MHLLLQFNLIKVNNADNKNNNHFLYTLLFMINCAGYFLSTYQNGYLREFHWQVTKHADTKKTRMYA